MSDRKMAILNDTVLFEVRNLEETLEYCIPRNHLLKGKSLDEVRGLFLELVQKAFDAAVTANNKSFYARQQFVYNAFYYLDFNEHSVLTVDNKDYGPGFYELNFFVRLGREVINE